MELDAIHTALRQRYRWLRFPGPLEAEFHASSVAARLRHLLICGLIGVLAYWLAGLTDWRMVPDIAEQLLPLRIFLTVLGLISMSAIWLKSADYRVAEGLTTFNALVCTAVVTYMSSSSHTLTAATHSGVIVGTGLYTSLVARQRFWFALATTSAIVGTYLIFVDGSTPVARLVILANSLLICTATVYALFANYTLEYQERTEFLLTRLDTHTREALARSNAELHQLSMRDPLTGLHNRRQFEADFDALRAQQRSLGLLLLDVDFFKRFNDGYGHPAGDSSLQQVAATLAEIAARESAVAGRLGGEEFALLLPDCDLDRATAIGEAVRSAIAAQAIPHRHSAIADHLTVSIGATAVGTDPNITLGAVLASADEALYCAKRAGRNRVAASTVPPQAMAGSAETATAIENDSAPESAATSPQDAIEQALRRGPRWMPFPAAIETVYQADTRRERRRRNLFACILGAGLMNVWALLGRSGLDDIPEYYFAGVLGLNAIFVLTAVLIALPIKGRLHEYVYMVGAICTTSTCAVVLGHSHSALAYALPPSFLMIPLFAVAAANQPFWNVCALSAATLLSFGVFVHADSPTTQLIVIDNLTQLTLSLIYILIAAYLIEFRRRQNYLLSQLDHHRQAALLDTRERLEKLSMLDPLTGIRNRRQFDADCARIWIEASADHKPLSLLIADIDFFKLYNDGYGHPAGDVCLRRVAQLLESVAAEARGTAVRLGGEEFGLLLPDHDVGTAFEVGERVCAAIRDAVIPHQFSPTADCVTISVGAATLYPDPELSPKDLLINADEALYRAKALGRNRVIAYVEPITSQPSGHLPAMSLGS